jgi:hypothetical protein
MKTRAIGFGVFFIAGLVFGFFTLQQLFWAVWGAPTYPVQYIALFSSLPLFLSSFLYLVHPVPGRALATLSLLGMGTLYIPAASSLVPTAGLLISPVSYLMMLGYFALLAFALFFPTRLRASIPILAVCLCTSAGFAATTYVRRVQHGDMQWPSFVYFEWVPGATDLQVQHDPDGSITPATKKLLLQYGVTGTLRWSGGGGSEGTPVTEPRTIVICRSRISAPKDLHYAKRGTVIQIFDGSQWKSIPDQPDTYPAHVTLKTDGIVEEDVPGGGTEVGQIFVWPKAHKPQTPKHSPVATPPNHPSP